jgi:murein DD-endopeptidase
MLTLGKPARSRLGSVVALVVLAGVLLGGLLWWRSKPKAPTPKPPIVNANVDASANANANVNANVNADGGPAVADKAETDSAAARALKSAGYRHVHAVVNGPLETAIVAAVGRDLGVPLTQVVVRTLVWWVEIPGALRKGDTIDMLVTDRPGEEPRIDAVRFKSEKSGKTFRAYRFQAPGEAFSRFYEPDGKELERRLENAPLDDYEQVTSLLRDGRGHKGVDFKTPVGSPVKAPFEATVERKNWNFKGNGNSIEMRENGGKHRTALFLHLSEIAPEVKPGATVSRGQVIAKSGNTGHSFAPHLHYQLQAPDGKILDPFASFDTDRRALPSEQKAAFEETIHKLDPLLE